jgi:hypothetical protein
MIPSIVVVWVIILYPFLSIFCLLKSSLFVESCESVFRIPVENIITFAAIKSIAKIMIIQRIIFFLMFLVKIGVFKNCCVGDYWGFLGFK